MLYKNLKTSDLVDKCVAKDALAWAEFVKRFSPLITFAVKRSFEKYSSNSGEASSSTDDLKQTILFSLWSRNGLEAIKNRENINYWLSMTSRNAVINYLKAGQKEIPSSDSSFFENIPAKSRISDSEIQLLDNKMEAFYESLASKDKIVFKLYFENNMTLRDITNITGMPMGTVSSLVSRIRKKFKNNT